VSCILLDCFFVGYFILCLKITEADIGWIVEIWTVDKLIYFLQ
jgi:hypothetical protein